MVQSSFYEMDRVTDFYNEVQLFYSSVQTVLYLADF